ncbi:hypothetical protein [Companilactobacillus versmoldensis]|uniref:Lipoprotein n=1 Tax=Companilactobacillus versmoldensis DSM 14857 = KCTC 3814 TaxID=1423815 RepID=A0A0R1SE80_9LACO|nr:hypothetical protein [Companilactobacillus versmoldensis]KRL67489.1 hypothetical protein FC27_GL001805 [Companilactobacillus versmoldensis DSM 14857 = KCTC 3814]
MRKGVIIVGLLSAMILSGCGHTNGSTSASSPTKTAAEKSSTVKYYQKLSKADKREIKFAFKAKKLKSDFDVSATVKNESKHSVKFKLSDFKVLRSDGTYRKSSREEKLVVKPHETVDIKHLFTGFSATFLNNSGNYFVYKDNENKLSRFNFEIAVGTATKQANQMTTTNGYKPTTNSEAPAATTSPEKGGSSSSSGSSGSSTATQAPAKTPETTNPNATATVLTSPEMATYLYMHSMGYATSIGLRDGITTTATGNGGYKVVDSEFQTPIVTYYNRAGDEIDANGNVISKFATLAGHTAAEPDGFVYNGINYSKY